MRIGVQLAAFAPLGADVRARRRELDEHIALAEELGYSQISLGHHYLAKSAFFQPQSLLAYAAGRTSRIRLGFGVLLLPLLPPVALAEELATLDVLSDGRLTIGIGAGYRGAEFAAVGIPQEERYPRLEQGVSLLRRLWRGEAVTDDGPFGSLEQARLHLRPVQEHGPPIWLGATGARGLRRVAELDVSWVANAEGDDDVLSEQMSVLRKELTSRGRSIERDYAVIRDASIATTHAQALERARSYALPTFQADRTRAAENERTVDAMLEQRCLLGTPDAVLERLRRWHEELGITDVMLRMDWGTRSHAQVLADMRFTGERVVGEAASWSAPRRLAESS